MRMSQYGHGKGTTQGGCSELSNISSKYLYPINSNITDEQGMDTFWHKCTFGIHFMPKLSEQPYSMFIFCGIICAHKKHVLSSQWVLLTISLKEFKLLENQF